jgi:predicted nucleotidyltransferase component of viral defense system
MPNVSQMLKTMAREQGVGLEVLQKDYAISYLLSSMVQTQGLGEKIVLKGGTALRKLYYPDYRFSEDLDFSTLKLGVIPNIDALLQAAVVRMADQLQERGPFEVQVEPLILRLPHPGRQIASMIRVRFPDQRQALCRLKVEITVDEPVLLPARMYPIRHGFSEPFESNIQGYALAEIAAEKLRALLQSRDKLNSRGWGASRVCRDYFDLWSILSREKLTGVPDLVKKKCAVRGVAYRSPDEFVSPELVETARREWNQQLSPFLRNPPERERVLAEIRKLVLDLFRAL